MSAINTPDYYKPEILENLNKARNDKDQAALERGLYLIFSIKDYKSYTDILLSLLDQEWHFEKENIVSILEETKDPKTIDKLYESAVNIPDYDDMRALAKKCMWALRAINTLEAIEKIKELSNSDDPITKEAALFHIANLDK